MRNYPLSEYTVPHYYCRNNNPSCVKKNTRIKWFKILVNDNDSTYLLPDNLQKGIPIVVMSKINMTAQKLIVSICLL